MIKCTNCESTLAQPGKFCPYCGSPIVQETDMTGRSTLQEAASPDPVASGSESAVQNNAKFQLIVLALGLAIIGGVLILVVAPELQGRYGNWVFGYVNYQTAESWAAMIGGGVCLLLAGLFLMRAITDH